MIIGPKPLQPIYDLIAEDLVQTNQFILEHLDSSVELIPELGTHLLSSGGKRLRPVLTLLASRLFDHPTSTNAHALIAAAVEFIHTATLLHDDVVDRSSVRRGKITANHKWGNKAPILVGDFLFSRVFQILVDHGDLRALKVIADTCATISEGEVLQLVVSHNLSIDEARYLTVIRQKTASLFAAAARLGAVINHRSEQEEEHLAEYGKSIGIAYQLVDDALDYSARQKTLGKQIGDDFHEGKITLPVIHAFQNGTENERDFWRESLEENREQYQNQNKKNLDQAIALLTERGSLTYTMEQAQSYADMAKASLNTLPEGPARDALIHIADFSVDRTH